MNKATFSKPTLTLFTGILLTLTGYAIASHSPSNTVTYVASDAPKSQQNQQQADQLIQAIKQNQLSKIEQMINNGFDINTPLQGDGTTLMLAVKHNNPSLVDSLINLGADINQASLGDGNPLIVASKQGHLNMVKHLIDLNADINAIVKHDETALITASRQGHYDIVKYLVEKGADVNLAVNASTLKGSIMRSPLNQAANNTIKDYLISQGAQ